MYRILGMLQQYTVRPPVLSPNKSSGIPATRQPTRSSSVVPFYKVGSPKPGAIHSGDVVATEGNSRKVPRIPVGIKDHTP